MKHTLHIAYSGYTPEVATLSLRNYRCHMGFLLQPKYDKHDRVVAATIHSFLALLQTHVSYYVINAILYSLLEPVHYTPFKGASNKEAHEIFWSVELAHLGNNFCAAGMYTHTYILEIYRRIMHVSFRPSSLFLLLTPFFALFFYI